MPTITPLRLAQALVLALAVGLRVWAWNAIELTPWGDAPRVDAYTYWQQAMALLEGGDPFSQGFYQPPTYPWLLSLLFEAVAPQGALSTVRLVQHAVGVATVAGLMRAGQVLGGRLVGAPWAGVVAGAVWTLHPWVLIYELELLAPSLTAGLLVSGVVVLVDREVPAPWRLGVFGLCVGAAGALHPMMLAAAAGALPLLVPRPLGRRRELLALGLGLAIALAPTTWQNLSRWGQLALVSHNSGLNLYLGNNPDWKRTAFLRPGLPFRQLVVEAEPHRRDTFERNRYWRERALSEMASSPGAWLGALATKAAWSVNNREIPRNEDMRCRLEHPALAPLERLPVRYGLALPLALLGALRLWGDARGRALLASWLALQGAMVLFLVSDRYRLASWPVVALAAGVGAGWGAQLIRRGGRPPTSALVALGLGLTLPWLPIDGVTAKKAGWCLQQRANFALEEQDHAQAIALYEEALRAEPWNLGARHWLGVTLQREGRHADAVEAFDRVLEDFPDSYSTLMAASRSLAPLDRHSEAADRLAVACDVPGPRQNTCVRYIQALVKAGRRQEAREVLIRRPSLQDHPKVRELELR